MKSDHRHELKTNELADWLMHFPQWAEENRSTLMIAGAVVVVLLGIYVVRLFRGEAAATRDQVQLTRLASELTAAKGTAAGAPDKFLGFGPTATNLKSFAERVGDPQMAAFALIKRGDALRAELHYGASQTTPDEVAKQIDQARQSYTEALQKAGTTPSLAAAAQFGLALCEEELGNLDKAKTMYHEIGKNPEYEGTAARAAAVSRVKTVDEYKAAVVFPPAPPKPAVAPFIDKRPSDANAPAVSAPNSVTAQPAQPAAEANRPAATKPAEPNR